MATSGSQVYLVSSFTLFVDLAPFAPIVVALSSAHRRMSKVGP
jgi:hypothetical protein